MKKEKLTGNLMNFITNATCAFTSVSQMKEILIENNYQELLETEEWQLTSGNYFVTRNDASIIAFKLEESAKDSFSIVASHCDTPALLLKPKGENVKDNYLKYNIMPYGGLLNYGWLDHPLSLAGRVIIKKDNIFIRKIVDFKEPILVVPSVAIHQNDKANSNLDLNMQIDLQPILSLSEKTNTWDKILKKHLKLKANETLCDYDLFAYNPLMPQVIGNDQELLLSPRIDNITSVYASLESFIESKSKNIPVFCCFNNEEIGSLTKEGADSNFLLDILKRIAASKNFDITTTLAKSFIVSSDNTHAIHPNHPEYADATGALKLGEGFAIVRETTSTTESYFSSLLKSICEEKKIMYQDSTAKNDLAGGSTLSGLSLRHVSITSIDVGIPQLAMHSSVEVCSINDFYNLYLMMLTFYNSYIEIKKENTKII